MATIHDINEKRDAAIDAAIAQFLKAKKLYALRQFAKELRDRTVVPIGGSNNG